MCYKRLLSTLLTICVCKGAPYLETNHNPNTYLVNFFCVRIIVLVGGTLKITYEHPVNGNKKSNKSQQHPKELLWKELLSAHVIMLILDIV